jgi:hypothetical protein
VTRDQSPVYSIEGLERELRQAEILSNVTQYLRNPQVKDVPEDQVETFSILHPYAIILSQDCDLFWEFEAGARGEARELNGVLLYEAEPADELRAKQNINSNLWRPIRQNKSERYHLLEEAPPQLDLAGVGVPQLLVDFKRYFTLNHDEIYRQLALKTNPAKRRCRLEMPYREHLQGRAAYFFQRVVLPLDHVYVAPEEETERKEKKGKDPATGS